MTGSPEQGRTGSALLTVDVEEVPKKARAAVLADAGLIAHLLAMRHDEAAFRNKRRADPQTAALAYQRAAMLGKTF